MNACGHAEAEISGSGVLELTGELDTLVKNIAGSGVIDTTHLRLKHP